MTTWVELCCGSAAVTLRLLGGPRAVPPCGYMGGKRRYAPAILDALGARRMQPDRVVLCDAGLWGRAWCLLCDDDVRRWAVDELRHMATRPEKGRDLFDWIASQPVPEGAPTWLADFLALQSAAVGSKPVAVAGGAWRTAGYASPSPGSLRLGVVVERPNPAGIADRVDHLGSINWSCVEARHGDVRDVHPFGDAVVYIDPDYLGTTGYGHSLPRPDLLALAQRWVGAGAVVAISEAEPLPLPGWHHVALPEVGGWQARTFGETREWLTMSREPAKLPAMQASLALEGAA